MNRCDLESPVPGKSGVTLRFGLRTALIALAAVSVLFAVARWLSPLLVALLAFYVAMAALHVFGTAVGKALRRSRPDERLRRVRRSSDFVAPSSKPVALPAASSTVAEAPDGELGQRRATASLALWTAMLLAGALAGGAIGFLLIGATVFRDPEAALCGVLAFAFLGAVASGLSYTLAASLFVAHRQSVEASEAEGPRR